MYPDEIEVNEYHTFSYTLHTLHPYGQNLSKIEYKVIRKRNNFWTEWISFNPFMINFIQRTIRFFRKPNRIIFLRTTAGWIFPIGMTCRQMIILHTWQSGETGVILISLDKDSRLCFYRGLNLGFPIFYSLGESFKYLDSSIVKTIVYFLFSRTLYLTLNFS